MRYPFPFCLLLLCLLTVSVSAQTKMTAEQYIEKYGPLAVKSMKEHGIPASIKLAQGLLESGNGGSRLAVKGNNHFGIKCRSTWTGKKIYHDDDAKGECFRAYRSVEQSYTDHSKFLKESPRYASLFQLQVTDYKGWAHGLKAAGYATNPQYPQLLINLIEKHRLYELDQPSGRGILSGKTLGRQTREPGRSAPLRISPEKNNGVCYIILGEGETLASIASGQRLTVRKLMKFNDLISVDQVSAGDPVYLQNKKNRSRKVRTHTVQTGESYHSISQQYGIKLKSLQKMNPAALRQPPRSGQQLKLK